MALHSVVNKFEGHAGKVNGVAFSKNTTLLASASHDATVRMWHLSTMKVQRGFKKDSRPVHALAFSPDGNTLATGHDDGGVVLWSVSSGKKLKMVCKHANLVSAVEKRRDYEKKSRSLKISHSHLIGIIPLRDTQFLLADKEFLVKVSLDDVSFSLSDGSTFNEAIIGVGVSSSHQLWVATHERVIRYSGLNTTTKKLCTIAISNLTSMAVSERTVVVACNTGISAFDHNGIHLWTHQNESLFPRKVAFSADEQHVIVCTKNWLTILSATNGHVLRQICHGLQGTRCVAAVPFSDLIIIGEQQRVSIWTLQGNFVDTLNVSAVNAVAVLDNGDIVIAEQHNKKELKILL